MLDFVADSKPTVAFLARRHACPTHPVGDLERIGLTGAWRASLRFSPDRGSFAGWAWHFVRGEILGQIRRDRGRTRSLIPEFCGIEEAINVPVPDGSQGVERQLDCRVLLQRLSPRQRRIMELTYLHGLTSAQIAELDGLSWKYVDTVRQVALQRIRRSRCAQQYL